jgi:hypothetical protein
MRNILIAFLLLAAVVAKGQTTAGFCVQVNCPITIQLPISSAQLLGSATVTGDTVTGYKWAITGLGGTLTTPTAASTTVTGLNSPGTYSFALTVTTKHGSVMTNPGSVVTVLAAAPVIPPPPVITGITITLFGQTFTIPAGQNSKVTATYNGATITLIF